MAELPEIVAIAAAQLVLNFAVILVAGTRAIDRSVLKATEKLEAMIESRHGLIRFDVGQVEKRIDSKITETRTELFQLESRVTTDVNLRAASFQTQLDYLRAKLGNLEEYARDHLVKDRDFDRVISEMRDAIDRLDRRIAMRESGGVEAR